MNISPDQTIFYKIPMEVFGKSFTIDIDMTLVGTWILMIFMYLFFKNITKDFNGNLKMTRMQNMVEILVKALRDQIESMMRRKGDRFIPLIGSLFVFIIISNWSALIPIPFFIDGDIHWYLPPTGSISTTAALSIVVMSSVVIFGMMKNGIFRYFKRFFEPVFILFPLNVLGEISSGVALAIRLYGNIMSTSLLAGIVFILAPFILPGLINIYGLLAATIQPYIFSVLAIVYISAGIGEPSESETEELLKLQPARF